MKRFIITTWLLAGLCFALSAQLLDVKLGTPESQLLLMAQAKTRQDGQAQFSLVQKLGTNYVFRQVIDGYQVDLTFTVENEEVTSIKTIHQGLNDTHFVAMREYFEETVKAWHNKSYFVPNARLADQAMKSFSGYQAQAAAFTDPSMSLMFVFVYYEKDGVAYFSRLERKF
ncbi:MAG: hypothetical protein AAF927_15275 [Bacteroidota bacterium]